MTKITVLNLGYGTESVQKGYYHPNDHGENSTITFGLLLKSSLTYCQRRLLQVFDEFKLSYLIDFFYTNNPNEVKIKNTLFYFENITTNTKPINLEPLYIDVEWKLTNK